LNFLPVRGFVLGSRPLREADRIVQLYTLSLGRVSAVAKGARSPKSKTASALELFTEGDFSLHKTRSGDLYVLGQAKVRNSWSALKSDLFGITALQVLADILTRSLQEAEPHREVYELLRGTLGSMAGGLEDGEKVLTAFALRFIELLGHPLELEVCASCGRALKGRSVFLVPHRGGALCPECCPSAPARLKVSPAGREVLKKLREFPLDRVRVVKLKPQASQALFLAMMEYLERTIEKELKSVEYYLQISEKIRNV
jgi:DNA repair protein RecO (recombination protein O)